MWRSGRGRDRDQAGAEAAAATLGSGHRAGVADVTHRAELTTALAAVEAAWDGYDLLVADAGVSTMNRAVDLTDDECDFNFAVNAKGVFLAN